MCNIKLILFLSPSFPKLGILMFWFQVRGVIIQLVTQVRNVKFTLETFPFLTTVQFITKEIFLIVSKGFSNPSTCAHIHTQRFSPRPHLLLEP